MRMQDLDWTDRHQATRHVARLFAFDDLPEGEVRNTSALCASLAAQMIYQLPDSSELVAGLRKLLEAKDCFVRSEIHRADPTGALAW